MNSVQKLTLKLSLLLCLAAPLWSAEIQYPTKPFKESLTVTGKLLTNLYVAGRSVTVETSIQGDLCAIAGEILISSSVQRNVEVVAGTLFLKKSVGDSVRVLAEHVRIEGSVGEDLMAAAGDLITDSGSVIQGDVALAGKRIDLNGLVKGRAFIAGDEVILNGPIIGDVKVRYEKTLKIGANSHLNGSVECFGPEPPVVESGLTVPNMVYHPVHNFSSMLSRWTAVFGLPALIRMLAWLFAAWLLTKVFSRIVKAFLVSLPGTFRKDVLLGLGALLGTTIILPVLFLTLIGSYAALLGGVFFITLILLARLLAVFMLSWWLRRIFEKHKDFELPFSWVGGAILTIHFSGLIPGLACFLISVLTLASLGSLTRLLTQWTTAK